MFRVIEALQVMSCVSASFKDQAEVDNEPRGVLVCAYFN